VRRDPLMSHVQGGGVREVKSAARTLDVLEALAARGNAPVTIRELCHEMNAPRSSMYALLRTLTHMGWVRTDGTRSQYSIGIRALLAGTTYLDTDPLLRVVQPHVEELSIRIGETVHYGRLDGADIVYLATHESTAYARKHSRVGRRLPAYSTSLGKAVLMHCQREALGDHLPSVLTPLTPMTIISLQALQTDLDVSRKRGFSMDNEENTPGLRCFGVGLETGQSVIDAMSISVPLERLGSDRERELVEALQATASLTSKVIQGLGGLLD
jgi:DNA-binding IclR family transcriptional regulator